MTTTRHEIEVLDVGLQATVQDLGRQGFGFLGVPEAGAADPVSLRLANRLVGNPETAAGIEILLGGFTVRFGIDRVIALAGAPCPAYLDERPIASNAWTFARAGQVLRTGRPAVGLRTYFAIAGGVDVSPVLGSRSTDTLSGMGPAALRRGSIVNVGTPLARRRVSADVVVPPTVSAANALDVVTRLGPRDDLFPVDAIALLAAGPWHISQETDRIAARLLGPPLSADGVGQLPTEGLAIGSIQVPPSGQPIVHLANHPPTGGYPVIAVVDRADVGRLAQAPPGTRIHFSLGSRPSFD